MSFRHTAPLQAAVLVALLLAVALPSVVLGHAELEAIDPPDRGTVASSPTEIVGSFSENLDPARSSFRVVNAANVVVAEGGSVEADKKTMRLVLETPLEAGMYTIRWTSFSTEDNEQDRGTTTFTVAVATPPPSSVPSPEAASSAPPSDAASPSLATLIPVASPSAPPSTPVASTSDALIPIVVALVAILGLGLWLLRGRSRRAA
jgi:copper resistance protein C